MGIHFFKERIGACPTPAARWIHQLQNRPMPAPSNDKMSQTVGKAHHKDRRQCAGFIQEKVVQRQDRLFGFQTELPGDFLDGVYGSAVDISLTGFTEPPVADRDAKTI